MIPNIKVIIPAYNEEASIGLVIQDLPEIVSEVIVENNHSTDKTAEVAQKAGATVLLETQKGYGYACLKGLAYIQTQEEKPEIVVFLDGDYSDYPEKLVEIVAKRGHYFKVVDMPRPLKALNGKVGITLEDEDGFRFTTESRNVKIIQDSYYAK